MKKHCSLVIVFLTLLVSVFPQKAWSQQDPPHRHCCFWINGAGLRLGAFMSMTKYHRALNWPIVAINDLFAIGNDIEVSNTLCSAFNQA